ncbi:glycogen synthase GlgA [Cetobacterium sp. 2A]|uniref:glycogen synthase GlgA n=1 Tax=Cetobacterium sp. 2A TaxID=2754723 RepID=UPI00163D078B|nr:glycogen synthase GlgA [Cetobacterium sp. 2A]MBC2856455.1 glycogen synthase GlgA [Cetobacterium sp. 2A]
MKILFATGEAWPFIKTGGLGEVAHSLPKSLNRAGVDIRVIMPKYSSIPEKFKKEMVYLGHKYINLAWRSVYVGVEQLVYEGVTYYFIDNEYYFKRHKIYGEFDDCERFAFFSKAVLETFDITGFRPDIIHCNDWHTGMIPLYLNDKGIKTIFTIHNLRFQGVFGKENLEDILGIDYNTYYREEAIKYRDGVSFMKAGINYSNFVSTVSETYANEIKTNHYGEGLSGLFNHIDYKLRGILNGIDTEVYKPSKNKKTKKKKLQKLTGLEINNEIPIVSVVTRLDRQKGIDLISCVFDEMMELDVQFILLGSGEHHYQEFFKEQEQRYPGKVFVKIGYNEDLAKDIYEGSDIFMMPSDFEPCGLSQMISMRYGTIPLVRETGGLADTVKPYNQYENDGTGFSFKNYNAHEMLNTLIYSLSIYKDSKKWKELQKRAMLENNSWENISLKYIDLYEEVIK